MIQFILNDREIRTGSGPVTTLLDFIRYEKYLTGTKIGCREGDCGACSILVGELHEGKVSYSSATSCLMPIANAAGKHVVTVEGINLKDLTAVQQAFSEEGATQCGFCTPGFIVSLTGYCLEPGKSSCSGAIDSMNGNICRCTGYKSIQRAAGRVAGILDKRSDADPLMFAVKNGIVPPYFLEIPERLSRIKKQAGNSSPVSGKLTRMGGGTDLYVQRHDTIADEEVDFLFDKSTLKAISGKGNRCEMGAAATVTDMYESEIFRKAFPHLDKYMKLVSSTPIRNMATIAGNFINASPIGDLTIFFLALDAGLVLSDGEKKREISLRKLYKGYKKLDKAPEEFVERIFFEIPVPQDLFNFEKVCKRTFLDIASVNSAIHLKMDGNHIMSAGLSAGGVGPVPMYLERASAFLEGKKISATLIHELISIAQEEISPISDARGTAEYKRLLLAQLIKAHFITLFPEMPVQHIIEVS